MGVMEGHYDQLGEYTIGFAQTMAVVGANLAALQSA